ncbi:MAG: CAP domain-containing protein, partial [Lachnospiraceae bacterium]|nr:CAP domain-containing protein [Lachnospiraceae bacterium]
MKKRLLGIMLAVTIMVTAFPFNAFAEETAGQDAAASTIGLSVEQHTPEEIMAFMEAHPTEWTGDLYKVEPVSAPADGKSYKAGELTAGALTAALNALNTVRYIAGIDANVTENKNYTKAAQAGAFINFVNKKLTHYPERPSGMSDELYDLGYSGTSSSNLAAGYTPLSRAVLDAWLDDGDSYNVSALGHRRWVLNPEMGQTGFGQAGSYTAMYAIDSSNTSASETAIVAWPAQQMPVDLLEDSRFSDAGEYLGGLPWSVSFGEHISESDVKVTVVRANDGKKWSFSSSSADGYFTV